jgi:zinc protease
VIAENAEPMLDLFADVALRPDFPESEVALYKKNREQNLIVQRQDPAFLATEQLHKAVYGEHPYAILAPTPASLAAIDRAKVEAFYKANFLPSGSVLVVNGFFDPAKMEAKLRALFGGWKAQKAEVKKFPALGGGSGRRIILVDRPESEQADFRVGSLGVARADADFYPLLVANAILGDGTSSRLFLNLREKKGYTYDVSSSVVAPRMRGLFFGSSETRNEVTGAAIREMLAEFERMRTQAVTETDLRNAKNYLNGNFSLSLSTQGGVTGSILRSKMLGLPADFLETYRQRVEAVNAEQVQQAAQKYMQTADAVIVVVGDAKKLKGQLAALGKVESFDIHGKPIP